MTRALLYWYWLELRIALCVTCSLTLLAAVGYGFAVYGAAGYFARSGQLTEQIARYEAILDMSPGPQTIPWAVHTLIVGFFALWTFWIFMGTGVGTRSTARFVGGHPSAYFTASLPVSRDRLVVSRFAAGGAGAAAVLITSLVANWIALVLLGHQVPVIAMAGTTLLGIIGGIGLVAIGTFFTLVVSESLSGLAAFGLTLALWQTKDGWDRTLDFISGTSLGAPAVVIVSSVLLILCSIAAARRKEL